MINGSVNVAARLPTSPHLFLSPAPAPVLPCTPDAIPSSLHRVRRRHSAVPAPLCTASEPLRAYPPRQKRARRRDGPWSPVRVLLVRSWSPPKIPSPLDPAVQPATALLRI